MNKAEMLQRLNEVHRRVLKLVQDFDKTDFEQPGAAGEWTAKDMFGHLAFWNWEAKRAIELAVQGERPTPWLDANVQESNTREAAARKDVPLHKIMDDFRRSHKSLTALVERTPESELARESEHKTPNGRSANATWIVAGVLHHYREHSQWLKEWLATRVDR